MYTFWVVRTVTVPPSHGSYGSARTPCPPQWMLFAVRLQPYTFEDGTVELRLVLPTSRGRYFEAKVDSERSLREAITEYATLRSGEGLAPVAVHLWPVLSEGDRYAIEALPSVPDGIEDWTEPLLLRSEQQEAAFGVALANAGGIPALVARDAYGTTVHGAPRAGKFDSERGRR